MDVGRPASEREVLRVLWASEDHLVRSQIHKRMPLARRPTLGRVGQILAALHRDKLLRRVAGKAQGARRAGFYGLSARGRRLCKRLGFEHEERLLFAVSDAVLRTSLTRERLVRRCDRRRRIVAVYGWCGGLGRTTLVAHVARGLAESRGGREPVLVVDLDLGASGLDDFFASHGLERCRGLGGLLVDFERLAPRKRALWLRGAVSRSEYVLQPLPGIPLFYLPSGLSPGSRALSPSERTEALTVLDAAAGLASLPRRRDIGAGFLSELRTVLSERFAWTVVDAEAGRSVGAWVAVRWLADELILCSQLTDTGVTTLNGLRAVLASFLGERPAPEPGGVMFLFRIMQHASRRKLRRWIERHLLLHGTEPAEPGSYWAELLPFDVRLAKYSHRWEYAGMYEHVIAGLRSGGAPCQPPSRPELQALLVVLDEKRDRDDRAIAAGVLKSAPLQEVARWVDWYAREGCLPRRTDARGEKLIDDIVEFHARRLRSSIRSGQAGAGGAAEGRP